MSVNNLGSNAMVDSGRCLDHRIHESFYYNSLHAEEVSENTLTLREQQVAEKIFFNINI